MAGRLAYAGLALMVLVGRHAASAPTQAPPVATTPAPGAPPSAQPGAQIGAQTGAQTGAQMAALPGEVQLDYMLSAGQLGQLAAVLSRPMSADDFGKALRWLRSNIEFGGSAMLGLLYSRDLWAIGENAKVADPAKDLRITAGVITLYTYAVIELSGARCEDQTAPSRHTQQLLDARKPTLDFIAHQSTDVRGKIVAAALALEQKSAAFRGNDDFVCRDDDEAPKADTATAAGDARGATPPAVKYADPAVWQPREAKLRAGLPAALRRMVAL